MASLDGESVVGDEGAGEGGKSGIAGFMRWCSGVFLLLLRGGVDVDVDGEGRSGGKELGGE